MLKKLVLSIVLIISLSIPSFAQISSTTGLNIDGTGQFAWAVNVKGIAEYSNNLATAVASIGSVTPTTLIIDRNINLGASVDSTPNILLWFTAEGGITQTGAYTLKIGKMVPRNWQTFYGFSVSQVTFYDGALNFVQPEMWGGCPGCSASTNVTALLSAATTKINIEMTGGTWSFNSNIHLVDVPLIYGVNGRTILQPTSAVTGTFLTIDTTGPIITPNSGWSYMSVLKDVEIDGSLTTNVTGVIAGSTYATYPSSADIKLEGVEVWGFYRGLRVGDVVQFVTERCSFTKNGENVRVEGVHSGYPTRVTIRDTNISIACVAGSTSGTCTPITNGTGIGLYVAGGDVSVENGIIESNDKEGIKVIPSYLPNVSGGGSAWGAPRVTSISGWFESNQGNSTPVTNYYHIYVSAAGGGSALFKMVDPLLSVGPTGTPKGAYFNAAGFEIYNPRGGSWPAGCFVADNWAYGIFYDYNMFASDYSTYVSQPDANARVLTHSMVPIPKGAMVQEAHISTTVIDFTNTSTGQLIYTVPLGKTFIPTKAILVVGTSTLASNTATIGGNATSYNDWLTTQTLTNLSATGKVGVLQLTESVAGTPIGGVYYVGGQAIYLKAGGTGASTVNTLYLYGILY